MPLTPEERIEALDVGLFEQVRSETSADDRAALLLLQRSVRHRGPYAYLEIGSHLGGTIQPHYVDPLCRVVYSIDKRPSAQPDERGRQFAYPDNSTARMRACLAEAFPAADRAKVVSFDRDASDVRTAEIAIRPALCLIDGEHTNVAVQSDFDACLRLAGPVAVVAFHDACYVFEGIQAIKRKLAASAVPFRGYLLAGSVYAILLGDSLRALAGDLALGARDEQRYFRKFRRDLQWERVKNAVARLPALARLLKSAKKRLTSLSLA